MSVGSTQAFRARATDVGPAIPDNREPPAGLVRREPEEQHDRHDQERELGVPHVAKQEARHGGQQADRQVGSP